MPGNMSTNNRARKLAINTNSVHSLSHAASTSDTDSIIGGQLGGAYTARSSTDPLYQYSDQTLSAPRANTHSHTHAHTMGNSEAPAPGWYCCRGQAAGVAHHYAGPWIIANTEVCLTCNHARCQFCVVKMIGPG